MKKQLLLLITVLSLTLTGCGVGVYSLSSGMEDKASICFVSSQHYYISVDIDGTKYETETIKQKPFKSRRNIKKTAKNQIIITPGRHVIKVYNEGKEMYSKELFVSATELKIIEL